MRKLLLALGLSLATGLARAEELHNKAYTIDTAAVTLLDLPFDRVDATSGRNCEVYFKEALYLKTVKDIYIDVD